MPHNSTGERANSRTSSTHTKCNKAKVSTNCVVIAYICCEFFFFLCQSSPCIFVCVSQPNLWICPKRHMQAESNEVVGKGSGLSKARKAHRQQKDRAYHPSRQVRTCPKHSPHCTRLYTATAAAMECAGATVAVYGGHQLFALNTGSIRRMNSSQVIDHLTRIVQGLISGCQ